MAEMIELIKQAAIEAVNASNPVAFCYGTVVNTSPLTINVEQKMELTQEFLILTRNVKDYEVDIDVNWTTEQKTLNANHSHDVSSIGEFNIESTLNPTQEGTTVESKVTGTPTSDISEAQIDLSHSHSIAGRKRIKVYNALKKGEEVILIKFQGGQRYVVLDRV